MSKLLARIDQLHAWAVSQRALWWFTWTVRILLAVGFLPSGLVKVLDRPFAAGLDPETNLAGRFFDTLHDAGFLYEFIGWTQLAAAVLLLVPRTATLGAAAYLPQIGGIVVITTTMGFQGTWVITSLMLLGNLYLLCWDWPRLRPLLGIDRPYAPHPDPGASGPRLGGVTSPSDA